MAIEPLKRVTVVSPKDTNRHLIKSINNLGMMEIIDIRESLEKDVPFTNYEASTEEADEKLYKIDFILNLINMLAPEKDSFIKGLTPLPLVTSREEISTVLSDYNLEENYRYANELDETYRRFERVIGEIEGELNELAPIKDLSFDPVDFFSPKRVSLAIGYVPKKNLNRIDPSAEPWASAAWEEIKISVNDKARMVFAFLNEDSEDMRKSLTSLGFEEIQLPRRMEKIADRMGELEEDLAKYHSELAETIEKVQRLAVGCRAGEGRRSLLILKAYWTNIRNKQIASTKGVHGKWVYVLSGYIRSKDTDMFMAEMNQDFPDSMVTFEDPSLDEDVPVSISVPYAFRPIQLLTEMFGLPPYRSFDPTPYMQINFYIFFGICFSDVGYGLMLVLSSAYLARKTKEYRGVHDFVRILLYGGISSIIFGALLGSWFGDLYKPEYLGQNNILLKLEEKLVVLDPMDKTIYALAIALGIGVLNQFFGIILKIYACIRQKDWMGAFSDGLCWIVTLTGLVILIAKVFAPIPPAVFKTGMWFFGLGALCLVFTQGRNIPNPVGRFATGLVSLYGIMGGYGITAFIGDTLSYCRLLALGLTTSIVAMAFNLMAGMLRDLPYIGTVLFIIVLLIGHTFNFLISALGAFVHSMRLIFVEFFGRFYDSGARPFRPLEFNSPVCVMKKTE